ncbi:MAG: hypothetical protein GY946_00140 [bacterium]|nr:hypothetical protein [bacterium]
MHLYAYHVDALPTGNVVYLVKGPMLKIMVKLDPFIMTLEKMDEVADLGRQGLGPDSPRLNENIPKSEQALVDRLAGCAHQPLTKQRLAGYKQWMNAHPNIAEDLWKREQRFMEWLQ